MTSRANGIAENLARVPVRRMGAAQDDAEGRDQVAVEEPLEIRLTFSRDGESHTQSLSITMRTPGDDVELATGFLLTEGIISSAEQIIQVDALEQNIITLTLRDDVIVDIASAQRNFYMTSSCGVCGKASLESLKLNSAFDLSTSGFRIGGDHLLGLPAAMTARQVAYGATGGVHAAATFDAGGVLFDLHEDIGRHNAVDKLVGAALKAGYVPLLDKGLLVSGRASFEIMQKAMMAGLPLVVAVGAPSSLAIDVAWEFGMTLAGFARDGRFNIYAGPKRIF